MSTVAQIQAAIIRNQPVVEATEIFRSEVKKLAKSKAQEVMNLIEEKSVHAAERVFRLVDSSDEQVATKNAHYILDHMLGKATQKSVSQVTRINIDVLAD